MAESGADSAQMVAMPKEGRGGERNTRAREMIEKIRRASC